MKFKSLFFVLFAVGLFAQGTHQDIVVKTPEGSSTFRISSTNSDTSDVYHTFGTMSVRFWIGDSIGGATDSSKIVFTLQGAPGNNGTGVMAAYSTINAWTVSADSVVSNQLITDSTIVNYSHFRYILAGDATDNRHLGLGSIARILHMNFQE
jgi:hypothetical protein